MIAFDGNAWLPNIRGGGAEAHSVERLTTGQEVVDLIPHHPPYWFNHGRMKLAETEVMGSPLCLSVAAHKIVRRQSKDASAYLLTRMLRNHENENPWCQTIT